MNTDQKGIDLLISAVSLSGLSSSQIQMTIMGEGTHLSQFLEQAHQVNCEDIVHFLPTVAPAFVSNIIQQHDFLVIASRYESFGVVAIEALASGIPVLATRCGGPEDIIVEGTGLLVDKNDSASLACGLKEIVSQLDTFQPKKLRRYAQEKFGTQSVVKQLNEVYTSVLSAV